MAVDLKDLESGDRLMLARALSAVENDTEEGHAILSRLYPHGGKAHLIGVTGSPGTGKSSLVNQIVLKLRKKHPEQKVAIIAVDPTSPFSGGAVLGDRVRMRDLSGDEGVFIRSMASRGALGGLAIQTAALAQVFDCTGFGAVISETVGAGQNEVDIVRLVHTTLVVEAPGLGDDIQAIKAGILEIADILVVNKADRPGVDATERALRTMLEMANGSVRYQGHHGTLIPGEAETAIPEDAPGWTPSVLKTVATTAQGVDELVDAVEQHKTWLTTSGEWTRREKARVEAEMFEMLKAGLLRKWDQAGARRAFQAQLKRVLEREISPQDGVAHII